MIYTLPRTSTTEMEVTSIRLERELKERLKNLALNQPHNQGYQALIRDILWDYVQQKSSGEIRSSLSPSDIRASMTATAQREERCAITGKLIRPTEPMLLGFTISGDMVPLSIGSLNTHSLVA